MRDSARILAWACALAAIASWPPAASAIESRPVHFAKGASSATLKGSLKGDQTIDYELGARAGQTMTVNLATDNTASYFNVLPPGSNDVAIFIGSTDGNDWSGTLPSDGTYKIRVYLMRSAARRNEAAHYTLTIGITGTPSAAALGTAPKSDAKVAGTHYHATGTVPCSTGDAPAGSSQCAFGVVRGSAGNAEVHVTPPGGPARVLTFIGTKVSASDGGKVHAVKDGDDWLVDVDDHEHYRIPEAVISGG